MIVSFGWRIRFEDEIFGPAARVQYLYTAARYIPDEGVWEYMDANKDWIEYLSLGRWRELLVQVRKAYNPNNDASQHQVPTDSQHCTLTYRDYHKQIAKRRIRYKQVLAGFHNASNLPIHPYNYWIKRFPQDKELWEQKAKDSTEAGLRALLKHCPDGYLTDDWVDGKVWQSARTRARRREEYRNNSWKAKRPRKSG